MLDDHMRSLVREALADALRDERPAIVAEVVKAIGGGRQSREEYVSTRRAAEIAGVRPDTIRSWIAAGLLKRYGPDEGTIRVKTSELYALLERTTVKVEIDSESLRRQVEATVARLTK